MDALATVSEPVGVWQLLNDIAKVHNPVTRAQARAVRQEARARITQLVKNGLVRRIGRRAVALT